MIYYIVNLLLQEIYNKVSIDRVFELDRNSNALVFANRHYFQIVLLRICARFIVHPGQQLQQAICHWKKFWI